MCLFDVYFIIIYCCCCLFCLAAVLGVWYLWWKFDPIVQVTEPEQVGETMCDVEQVEFFISQVEEAQDADVVLIPSNKHHKRTSVTS